jgi:peptide/nickel transport system permease protein
MTTADTGLLNEIPVGCEEESEPRNGEVKRIIRILLNRTIVIIGLIILITTALLAIFAPMVAPYDPYKPDLRHALAKPSVDHLLGTDSLGRDTLSRIIYGARTSMIVGLVAIAFAATVGMLLGLLAGYFEGWLGLIIMRWIDAQMAIPIILLALTISALLGGGLKNVIIALGIGLIPAYCRLMNGQTISVKQNDYILASRAIGSSDKRIMFRHVLPNTFPPLIVLITMQLGRAILAEAGLSFLGVGISPPQASWGSMVSDGYKYLLANPGLSFAPGVAIILVVFAFNVVGDGLRDALDPKLRGML